MKLLSIKGTPWSIIENVFKTLVSLQWDYKHMQKRIIHKKTSSYACNPQTRYSKIVEKLSGDKQPMRLLTQQWAHCCTPKTKKKAAVHSNLFKAGVQGGSTIATRLELTPVEVQLQISVVRAREARTREFNTFGIDPHTPLGLPQLCFKA